MNTHFDSSSALSMLRKSDLETFVFELLDFLWIVFLWKGNERRGKGRGLSMLDVKLSF